jgi:hypothetical protein
MVNITCSGYDIADKLLISGGVFLYANLKHVLESGLANQNHDSSDTITDLQNFIPQKMS